MVFFLKVLGMIQLGLNPCPLAQLLTEGSCPPGYFVTGLAPPFRNASPLFYEF